jgi:hypothetical protein
MLSKICLFLSFNLSETSITESSFNFIILLLILLSNDVELNPGPTTEGELSIFHLNTRSMRHKLDYIESICNEADITCLAETHLNALKLK